MHCPLPPPLIIMCLVQMCYTCTKKTFALRPSVNDPIDNVEKVHPLYIHVDSSGLHITSNIVVDFIVPAGADSSGMSTDLSISPPTACGCLGNDHHN